ncbi:MAG TPA: ATP-binding protein [Aliidongia sp.]|uniref:ATP-binding protein n=1 Tax=Aliidongia sp. TaxID=1914230 RepID=UPI002DDD1C6E|nr:ATP-binding protein [Aliidongia sp.]HEV2673641.1 ATP-binding protein [Aliidongia sp.]
MPDAFGGKEVGPILVLTPTGRDADSASELLEREAIPFRVLRNGRELDGALDETIGAVLVADEALLPADLLELHRRLEAQPAWSDLPFVVLTHGGSTARRALGELRLPEALGNVMFLERPLNALTLVSALRTALRARRRQRQVRDHLAERAAATEELTRSREELEHLVAERTRSLERAMEERKLTEAALARAQKMEAVGRLTGGIAHDFNNLLTAMVGSLELLQARVAHDPKAAHHADVAVQAADRGAKLTAQLLAFSRQQRLDLRPVDVNALVRNMDGLVPRAVGSGVEVRFALTTEGGWAVADPNQLELAILNLAINARDAMPGGGVLTIATGCVASDEPGPGTGEAITISVVDTGTGMSPEVLAHAFEPFYTTKGLGKGTGLGLAQVYGIARQSGGDVRIESEPGRGTTVSIVLPRVEQPSRRKVGAIVDDKAVIQPSDRRTRVPVLVIDDDPSVRETLVQGLEFDGFDVIEAADGRAGLTLLERGAPAALAVIDFAMPGMNGAEVARAVQRLRPGLPIIFASGYAETAALDRISGAVTLRKPFKIADLTRTIHHLLERQTQAAATPA